MRQIGRKLARIGVATTLIVSFGVALPSFGRMAESYYQQRALKQRGPVQGRTTSTWAVPGTSRIHDVGKLWVTMTNMGYFGNMEEGRDGAVDDPCTGEWSPQSEFPGGSGGQYLYRGSTWVGALIQEESFEYPRVTTGSEGWTGDDEFTPAAPVVEMTTRANATNCLGEYISSDEAVSEQDFHTSYADTGRFDNGGGALVDHGPDGPHEPLGIKVNQRSYAWSYNYAQDFIIIDFEIENIADKFLKNVYVGLFMDADVGTPESPGQEAQDDLCGFKEFYAYTPQNSTEPETLTINTAWVADNDGRPEHVGSGSNLTVPHVAGVRVVRAPNPRLRTSFNWWISNSEQNLDFGPSWDDDGSEGDWTSRNGTPTGDARKYFLMSNSEFDYDQTSVNDDAYINAHPQVFRDRFTGEELDRREWKTPDTPERADISNGVDTRYLISWGPLGIYDYTDDAGNAVFRLEPGEKFSMTFAYVAGEFFHDPSNPQPTNSEIDVSRFNFTDLQYNADWASKVYDNPMLDTPDHITGLTDGWYGEDVGKDGVYAEVVGTEVSGFFTYDAGERVPFTAVYNGPDPDGSELDGRLQAEEDVAPRPERVDYTYNNKLFDQGDGIPDFKGPPPPPSPVVTYRTEGNDLILRWEKNPSEAEDYKDPFSRQQDFEGYRVYVSNSGDENQFSFLAEFDHVNYSYYTASDSLVDKVYYSDEGLPQQKEFRNGTIGYLKKVNQNISLDDLIKHRAAGDDSTYEFRLENVHPMMPRYYAVTAFDYGDYRSGTEPLESAKTASMVFSAPANTGKDKKPGVVPNPYRADADYTKQYLRLTFDSGDETNISWENNNDGTTEFYPQTDRRIFFYNLPEKALVRIFTVAGDLVQVIEHGPDVKSTLTDWQSPDAVGWDLSSRNNQQVVSGLYLFSVEDLTEENKGDIDVGKFVIIR